MSEQRTAVVFQFVIQKFVIQTGKEVHSVTAVINSFQLCLYSVFVHYREISVEKLSMDSDTPPKSETRRDMVDAPAALVSK